MIHCSFEFCVERTNSGKLRNEQADTFDTFQCYISFHHKLIKLTQPP